MTHSPEELLEMAQTVAENAYAPYSHFRVGAVARWRRRQLLFGRQRRERRLSIRGVRRSKRYFGGCNGRSHKNRRCCGWRCLDATREDQSYPCGQCRQRLNEFRVETVIVAGHDGRPRIHSFEELLPFGFRLDQGSD